LKQQAGSNQRENNSMTTEAEIAHWRDRVVHAIELIKEVRGEAFEAPKDDKWTMMLSEATQELSNLLAWLRTLKPQR
jgi:hypothetical protein